MKTQCANCGKTISVKPSKLRKFKHAFCSRACYGAWQKKEKQQSSKPCATCGKPVFANPARLEKGDVYCSRSCFRKSQFRIETKSCEHCSNPVTRRPSEFRKTKHVFCSQKCCNAWRTGRPRPEHGAKVRKALKGRKPSPQCMEASRKAASRRLKDPTVQAKMQEGVREYYKDNPGPNKDKFGAQNYNWRGGTSFEPYSEEFNDPLKEQIRKRDGYVCQLCDMTQKEHVERYERKLIVHHIDYDKQNCDPHNLISLCFSCHGKTNGNRKRYKKLLNEHIAHTVQHG